jgi:hypothetical protein
MILSSKAHPSTALLPFSSVISIDHLENYGMSMPAIIRLLSCESQAKSIIWEALDLP